MKQSAWLDERPVRAVFAFAAGAALLVVLSLGIGLGYLPRDTRKTILVTVEYRGSSESEMERLVAVPMEEHLARVEGVREIYSVSERDRCRISIEFLPSIDLDGAYLDAREAVQAVYADLPDGVQRPFIRKSDSSSPPVFIAAFDPASGRSEDALRKTFENVEGAGEVEVGGGRNRQLRVLYSLDKLAHRGLPSSAVVAALRNSNLALGFGREMGTPMVLDNRPRSAAELGELPLQAGTTLADVAEVALVDGEADTIVRVNGREKQVVYVRQAGDADPVRLCAGLRAAADALGGHVILYDHGRAIESSLSEIAQAMLVGAAGVVVATVFLLGSWPGACVAGLSIPFAVLAALPFIRFSGLRLDVMVLAGLGVGIGLVINSAAVYAHAFGRLGGDAAKALCESAAPILYSAATTLAVFLPFAFAPPAFTDQFGGLAVAASASVLASLVYVFVFMPPFLRMVRRPLPAEPIIRPAGRSRLSAGRVLPIVFFHLVRRPRLTGCAALAAAAGGVVLLADLPFEEFSFQPGGRLNAVLEFPSGTPLAAVAAAAEPFESMMNARPALRYATARYEAERARLDVFFESSAAEKEAAAALKKKARTIPGAFLYLPENDPSECAFDVILRGSDLECLKAAASSLAASMRGMDGVTGIVYHFKEPHDARVVKLNLPVLQKIGLDARAVHGELYWALNRPVADKWVRDGRELDIHAGAAGEVGLARLLAFPASTAGGRTVFISVAAEVDREPRAGRISRIDSKRSIAFSVNATRTARAQALERARQVVAAARLPFGYTAEIGRSEAEAEELARSAWSCLVLAAVSVLAVLVFQFEKIGVPLFILGNVPLAFLFPALLAKLAGLPLSLPFVMGLILSAGVGVNNAILVFDAAGGRRLRPGILLAALGRVMGAILASSLTTVLGVIPLAFTGQSGGGILTPLSLTLAAGVAGSLVSLVLTLPLAAVRKRR